MAVGIPFAGQYNTDPASHIRVARCADGSWIAAYVPVRQLMVLDTSGLRGASMRVSVYDPESQQEQHSFVTPAADTFTFVPERDLDTFVIVDSHT